MTSQMRLKNKHILLGVTGSIAAYKACEVLRILQREGAELRVVMTQAAQRFVASLTFETLSKQEVVTELFPEYRVIKTRHVSLAEWSDCILVCPATANIIGKVAAGIADDFLTTVIMASRRPVIFAPAMDYEMVQNPIYRENCKKLEKLGYRFVETEEGDLASGAKGPGRLAAYDRITQTVRKVLLGSSRLKDVSILVTAGPTQESLDPVRYLTNRSSGKMGYALAEQAALRGAAVTLVSGPSRLKPPDVVTVRYVETADEMHRAVIQEWKKNHILIMAAAVADYTPAEVSSEKVKKKGSAWALQMRKTEDILTKASAQKKDRLTVGFALETEDGEKNALGKLKEKHLDLICLNNPKEAGAAFDGDTNKVMMIDRYGKKEALPLMSKWDTADRILDKVETLFKEK